MATPRISDIDPGVLDKHLPDPAPYGTLEWHFVLKTAQVTFVKVDEFEYRPNRYLRSSVVLGVRTDPAVNMVAQPEFSGVFGTEDAEGEFLCTAYFERQVGNSWSATFRANATQEIGHAKGTVGENTPPEFIEASLTALARHAEAKNAAASAD